MIIKINFINLEMHKPQIIFIKHNRAIYTQWISKKWQQINIKIKIIKKNIRKRVQFRRGLLYHQDLKQKEKC